MKCVHAKCKLFEHICDLRKGPAERAQFPTMSSVSSPYQQLGQCILVLGRKIDSAQELKADLQKLGIE